jgi:hypothetical protein
MHSHSGVAQALVLAISAILLIPSNALQAREQGNKKPSLSLKASPSVSFAPARVVVVAELKGGPDDLEEFYCPTVEWEWGDETTSTAEADCDPYSAGKSEIKRRFTVEHVFRAGSHQIAFRLKRRDKAIVMATTTIQVQSGGGEFGR